MVWGPTFPSLTALSKRRDPGNEVTRLVGGGGGGVGAGFRKQPGTISS